MAFILFFFLQAVLAVLADGRAYRARVVAANPVVPKSCADKCAVSCGGPFPDCLIEASLKRPIEMAAADLVDIIVFPEVYGVEDILSCPPQEEDLLPKAGALAALACEADEPRPWWVKVACLAKKWQVIVVLGVYDWGPCTAGPDPFLHRPFPCVGNLTVFNKAVAFGVDGTLLAVHHKHHMAHSLGPAESISIRRDGIVYNPSPLGVYNDDVAAAWPVPDVTVFTSHFGVKFGIIICHEMNFASPLRSMISNGVRDIIFPTQWGGAYGGNFAATQSGFAVVHQVNLLSANGMSGGSGIWPADPKRAPEQFLVTASMPDSPTQWFGTMDLDSPAEAIHPPLMAPPPVYPMISKTQMLNAANASGIIELNLPDVRCHLDFQHANLSGGSFLFGASAGINTVGMFEASCWIFSCDLLLQPSKLIPDLARIALWPITKEDYSYCRQAGEPISFSGRPRLEIEAPASNVFLPLGQCQDTSIPVPRPSAEAISTSSQRLVLPTQCPMSFGGLRSFAQAEFEEPQCPNGFCPSPSLCNDTSWELKADAWCYVVPGRGIETTASQTVYV